MEQNCCRLSGVVLAKAEIRYSPAGVAHQQLTLEHRSRSMEAGRPRLVTVTVTVEARAGCVAQLAPVQVGDTVLIDGFLDRAGLHNSTVILHVQQLTRLMPDSE